MKKYFAAFTAILIAASLFLAACDSQDFADHDEAAEIFTAPAEEAGFDLDEILGLPAIEIVNLAGARIEEAGSALIEEFMDMHMNMLGIPVDMQVHRLTAIVYIDDETIELASESAVYMAMMFGELEEAELTATFFRDGYLYTYADGEGIRQAMDMETVLASAVSFAAGSEELMEGFVLDAFELTEYGLLLEFVIDADFLAEEIGALADSSFGDILGLGEEMDMFADMEFEDVSFAAIIDFDGFLRHTYLVMTMIMTMDEFGDVPLVIEMVVSSEFLQFGDIEIEFPDYLDEFELVE